MLVAANNARRNVYLALLLVLPLSLGIAHLSAVDDMDGPCSADMMWMVGWCLDGITADPSIAAAAATQAVDYVGDVETIDVPFPGVTASRVFGINARGDIVGSYSVGTVTHGYVRSGGIFTTIDYPGAASTEAWGINPRGDIIGRYTLAGVAGTRGFLLSRGTFSDISIRKPDGTYHAVTLPTKIGASGDIVGCFHDASGLSDMYGYVQRGGYVTTMQLATAMSGPNGSSAMHNGVTPGGGTIVGLTLPSGPTSRAYILRRGTLTLVDFPGSTFTQLWDVNPSGTMVGNYTGNGRVNGFYIDTNGYHTVNVPSSTMTVARGINPEGAIVGVYNDASGRTHGFVLRQ
jgi:hypothetical protein